MKKNPDFHRLQGFLHLSSGRTQEARESLGHSLALRADGFLFYLIGTANLALLPDNTIAASFREAALSPADPGKTQPNGGRTEMPGVQSLRGVTKDGTISVLFPLRCILPGDSRRKPGEPGIEFDYLKDVFRDPAYMALLWDHKLTRSERAVSAALALAFLSRSDAKRSRLEEIVRIDGPHVVSGFRGTDAMMRDTESDDPIRGCIASLENEERRLVESIQNGIAEPGLHLLTAVRAEIRRTHRYRALKVNTLESIVAYGTYLLRERDGLGALHTFRHALYRFDREGVAFAGRHGDQAHALSSRAMLYRQIASAYKLLGRENDARTTNDFAAHLDGVLITAQTNAPEVNAGLVASSLANLKNREGLLLLIAHGPASRRSEFQNRLRERDKQMDMEERLSAFRKYD